METKSDKRCGTCKWFASFDDTQSDILKDQGWCESALPVPASYGYKNTMHKTAGVGCPCHQPKEGEH